MSLVNITSNTQTGVIGALLILSVLIPNWTQDARGLLSRRRRTGHTPVTGEEKGG
jgi:ribose/xylose/arabinose/galactoside ABC-type transport system permease subunit